MEGDDEFEGRGGVRRERRSEMRSEEGEEEIGGRGAAGRERRSGEEEKE